MGHLERLLTLTSMDVGYWDEGLNRWGKDGREIMSLSGFLNVVFPSVMANMPMSAINTIYAMMPIMTMMASLPIIAMMYEFRTLESICTS